MLITSRAKAHLLSGAALLVLTSSLLAGSAARAADAAAAATSSDDSGPTQVLDVVVTAQKRSEDIKSVPISISALSGQDLKSDRIANFDDLSRVVPGVSFDSNGTEGTTNISIRGVSSSAGSATVGLYLDDVSITTKNLFYEGAAEPKLADLERIEVLRGPQGTLYGDSSEGGTIRYIAAAPSLTESSLDLVLDGSSTEHGGGNYSGSVNFNIPVIKDVFGLRGSFSSTQDSGWINHYTQDLVDYASVGGGTQDKSGVNSDRIVTGHLTGKLALPDGWTVTPALFVQHVYVNDSSAFYLDTPGLGLYAQNKEVQEFGRDDLTLASLNVKKNFGFADFTSITGLFERKHARQEDGTYFNSTTFAEAFLQPLGSALPNPVNPAISAQDAINIIGNLPSAVHLTTKDQQFTQELRLSSSDTRPDAPVFWVTGLYFAQQTVHNTDFQQIPGINSTFLNLYGTTMENSAVESNYNGGVAGTTLFPDDIDESDNRTYKETQYSAFGQLDLRLAPDWKLGVGGRVEHAAEHFDSVETGFYQIGNISPYHQDGQATTFTPKLTLTHDLNTDQTLYASAGQGFRLGGPTGPITFGPNTVCSGDFAAINQTTQPTKFGSDSLWTYELGSKGRLFDGRLFFSAAGFYTNWKNIQQQIYLPTCGYYFTENVGDAEIFGGEVEASLKLTHNLRLNFNASSETATITKSINPTDVPTGSTLIDVPVGSAKLGAVYSRDLTDEVKFVARADYDWTGRSHGSYQSVNANYYNPSYGVANASVALDRAGYEIALYVKNLFDDKTIIQSPEINTVVEGYTVHPRTIGVTLKAGF